MIRTNAQMQNKLVFARRVPAVGYVLSMVTEDKEREGLADGKHRSEDSTEETNCQSSGLSSRENKKD